MNTEQERAELLPCPFCGEGKDLIVQHHEGTIIHPAYRIYCGNCGSSSGYADRVDPAKNWNRRAALQSQDDPLQPAANWLFKAIAECKVADIRWALRIGHNRAQRLFDHARRVEGDGE